MLITVKPPRKRVITTSRGCIQIQNEVSNTFNKQNNFLWEFHQNYFTVIGSAFLKVNSLIQSNFKLKSRSDQANNSCYVIEPRWYDSFRLTIFQGQCSPVAFVTWKCFRCFFYRSSVFFLPEHNVMLSTADNTSSLCDGQLVCWKYNSFWWIWINNCGCYVARLVRNSVCTLNQLIKNQAKWRHCEWRIGMWQEEKIHSYSVTRKLLW